MGFSCCQLDNPFDLYFSLFSLVSLTVKWLRTLGMSEEEFSSLFSIISFIGKLKIYKWSKSKHQEGDWTVQK